MPGVSDNVAVVVAVEVAVEVVLPGDNDQDLVVVQPLLAMRVVAMQDVRRWRQVLA